MDVNKFYVNENEKPLDNLVTDGGFAGIFRTIGCIGDSLSSGEFETKDEEGIVGYHDFYEYSWGQYMARTLGNKVFNFSRGGMTAKEFCESFAAKCGVYEPENICQAYIIALGQNDITRGYEIGDPEKINVKDGHVPGDGSMLSYIAQIVKMLKSKQPDAKIFLMTMPDADNKTDERRQRENEFCDAIRKFSDKTKNVYTLDIRKYFPPIDRKFRETFWLGHMTPAGYLLFAKVVMSYIDYIIRNNHADFAQAGFIGTPYKYIKD